jgi:hypothetical protein
VRVSGAVRRSDARHRCAQRCGGWRDTLCSVSCLALLLSPLAGSTLTSEQVQDSTNPTEQMTSRQRHGELEHWLTSALRGAHAKERGSSLRLERFAAT